MKVLEFKQIEKSIKANQLERKIIIWGILRLVCSMNKLFPNFLDEFMFFDSSDKEGSKKLFEYISKSSERYFIVILDIFNEKYKSELDRFGYKEDDYVCFDFDFAGKFSNMRGLEIGGPSMFFYEIYENLFSCDCVNFSSNTTWTSYSEDNKFYYNNRNLGEVYITEGTMLDCINRKYDCILSANNLEHIANPIKAVLKWKEKLNDNGIIFIIVPNKEYSFDHNRDYTSFEHILQDFLIDTMENDLTHLEEILDKHDLTMDVRAGDFENFRKRSLDNYNNRCLHHHVFNVETLRRISEYCELEIIDCSFFGECIYLLCKNSDSKQG